jgi:antibiotic biosynthesis monooxygenase (ABM) superfamily enzyme
MNGGDEMYCLITKNQLKPGKMAAASKTLEKEFFPVLKKSPGFRACYAVAGPKGEYTGIMIFDSHSDANAYAKSPGRDKALTSTADLFESTMKIQSGEVLCYITP